MKLFFVKNTFQTFNMRHSILMIFVLMCTVHVKTHGQSCQDLRGSDENYAVQDGKQAKSYCDFSPSTAYTQCMCEKENNRKKEEQEREKFSNDYMQAVKEVNKSRKEAEELSRSGNYEAAISMLESRVLPLAKDIPTQGSGFGDSKSNIESREKTRQRQIEYTEGAIESVKAAQETEERMANEKTITLTSSNLSSSNNETETSVNTISTINTSSESIYQKRQREDNELAARERKNEEEKMALVNEMQRKHEAQIQLMNELDKELTNLSKNIYNSWATQRNFNNQLNSLTNIENNSISSIITEVKQKRKSIDNLYSQREIEKTNEIIQQGQTYTNRAKTQADADLSNSITGLAVNLGKISNEKKRQDAQKKLLRQQSASIDNLIEEFEEKITPRRNSYLQLAAFSVYQNEEDYYLELYNYNDCLYENAYSILNGNNTCTKPRTTKPSNKPRISGKDYYTAYLRKKKSPIQSMNIAAETLLELAIEQEPNNANWLYETTLIKKLNPFEKATILKKAHLLDKNNNKISEAYELSIEEVKVFMAAEREYILGYIKNKSDYEWELHSNLLGLYINNKHIFVNQAGQVLLKINKTKPGVFTLKGINQYLYGIETQFGNGLARIETKQNNKILYGFINTAGEIVIPAKYSDANQFTEGLAGVKDLKTQLWGYINLKGEVVIPCQFPYEVSIFSDGLAAIKNSHYDRGAYINKKGEVAIEGKFGFIISEPFVNGVAEVQTYVASSFSFASHEDRWKYIDTNGKFLFKKNFIKTTPFNKNGYAIVGSSSKWYIINKKGVKQHKGSFQDFPQFVNGRAKVDIGSMFKTEYIIIDETGNIPSEEKIVIETSEIVTALSNADSEKEREVVLNKYYKKVIKDNNGYRVSKKDRWGYINNRGEIIIPVTMYSLSNFSEGVAAFRP